MTGAPRSTPPGAPDEPAHAPERPDPEADPRDPHERALEEGGYRVMAAPDGKQLLYVAEDGGGDGEEEEGVS